MIFYEWNINTIANWNKKTFPVNNTRGQRIKCMLEAKEYLKAKSHADRIEELADFFIANAGLGGRFNDESGLLVCELIKDLDYWPEVNTAVQKKMQVNVGRTWYRTHKGEWRHVEANDEQQQASKSKA